LATDHGAHKPLFMKSGPDLEAEQIAVIAGTLKRYGCNACGTPKPHFGVMATLRGELGQASRSLVCATCWRCKLSRAAENH
jgi:hypothetical protein